MNTHGELLARNRRFQGLCRHGEKGIPAIGLPVRNHHRLEREIQCLGNGSLKLVLLGAQLESHVILGLVGDAAGGDLRDQVVRLFQAFGQEGRDLFRIADGKSSHGALHRGIDAAQPFLQKRIVLSAGETGDTAEGDIDAVEIGFLFVSLPERRKQSGDTARLRAPRAEFLRRYFEIFAATSLPARFVCRSLPAPDRRFLP